MARVAAGVKELGARELVELEANEVKLELAFEAVLLVEGEGRQV